MSETMTTTAAPADDEGKIKLRLLVHDHYHYGEWAKSFRNVLKLKANGQEQKRPTRYVISSEYEGRIAGLLAQVETWKDEKEKEIKQLVRQLPIWREWAVNVHPLGEITVAYWEAYVELEKALDAEGIVVPSKVRRFCGYDPTAARGTPGKRKYCDPLKQALVRWGLSLEKQGAACESPYHTLYLNTKERLANSEREVKEYRVKGQPPVMIPWKDARPEHRREAALRPPTQVLITDYVLARAALEGRKVRTNTRNAEVRGV